MTTLKEHLFTKKSGIRHFVILGITALIFGIYCILAAKANPAQWFTKSLNDSQRWKLFIMAGLLTLFAALFVVYPVLTLTKNAVVKAI